MEKSKKLTKVTVHAGHNKSGRIGAGTSAYLNESTEARKICRKVIRLLRKNKIKAYNCTVNNGKSQLDILQKICRKCNAKNRQLDISIHFNASSLSPADNYTKGTEVLVQNPAGIRGNLGNEICKQISNIGFQNRGVKSNTRLYFLNHTNKPAILIEVCFVDDEDDAKLYKKHRKDVAAAIVKAIINYNQTL